MWWLHAAEAGPSRLIGVRMSDTKSLAESNKAERRSRKAAGRTPAPGVRSSVSDVFSHRIFPLRTHRSDGSTDLCTRKDTIWSLGFRGRNTNGPEDVSTPACRCLTTTPSHTSRSALGALSLDASASRSAGACSLLKNKRRKCLAAQHPAHLLGFRIPGEAPCLPPLQISSLAGDQPVVSGPPGHHEHTTRKSEILRFRAS